MKKINRFISREDKRIVSFLLATMFILTAILASGVLIPIIALAEGNNNTTNGEQIIIRDDALHFVFRHWHTDWDEEVMAQGSPEDQWDVIARKHFVVVEGYIIPHNESEMSGKVDANKYTIVLVDQKTGELIQASTLYKDYSTTTDENGDKIWPTEFNEETGEEDIVLKESNTRYLGKMDKTEGFIELKVKKLADVYWDGNEDIRTDTEKYCGISLSAGRNAAKLIDMDGDDGEIDTIRIQYSKNGVPTHIVKGHIFYSDWTKTVFGTNNPKILNEDDDVDTTEAYTWGSYGTTGDVLHQVGSIVEYTTNADGTFKLVNDGSGTCLRPDDPNLEAILEQFSIHIVKTAKDTNVNDIVLTTFYSTYEGLHTNKTLAMSADGRYFLIDLEAWYIDGYAAQLGYVIDASGSMAGTSDMPSILNIYVAIANRLGILFDENTGYYSYSHYDAAVVANPYHTHTFKTMSLPFYEVYDSSTKKTTIIQETKITRLASDGTEIKGVDADTQIKPNAVDYVAFEEHYEKLEEIQNNSNLELIATCYAPSDAEHRDDMHKFLITGGKFTESIKHPGKCWSGLANEFGIPELCETISKTIGDNYRFTEADWNTVVSLKGGAATVGNSATKYVYPQRASLIGYYEIRQNSSDNKRTWYFNSIDVKKNDADIYSYITPSTSVYGSYGTDHFALAVYPQAKQTANGGNFNFNQNAKAIIEYTDFNGLGGFSLPSTKPGWGTVPANFNDSTGFNLAGGATGYADSGFMLSKASTPNGNFTVSFDVQLESSWGAADAEILYIGSYDGTIDKADFRLVRENKDIVLYHGGTRVVLVSNYTKTTRQTFTLTYDKDTQTVVFYVGGASTKVVKGVNIDKVDCIVFDPFYDWEAVSGNNKFWVDDILVYDTELTMTEVLQLVSAHNSDKSSGKSTVDNTTTTITWDDVFLSEGLLNLFMNPYNTAHVPLGVAAYSYFVYLHSDNGSEFYPLAYWEGENFDNETYRDKNGGKITVAKTSQGDDGILAQMGNYSSNSKAGWYYLSHRSDNTILTTVGTSKVMYGMSGSSKTDEVVLNANNEEDSDAFNTFKEYQSKSGASIPFYIDGDGNLRCFYTNNAVPDSINCSYVYELDDKDYVKSETLQRILAYFNSELNELIPSSKISAVQFSNKDRDIDSLVLLDWSSNPDDIAGILSQKYGDPIEGKTQDEDYGGKAGYATGWTKSDGGVTQYNFALTGGTTTDTGLHAFLQKIVLKDVIVERNSNNTLSYYEKNADGSKGKSIKLSDIIAGGTKYRRDDLDAPKFVIVFTDGVDDNADERLIPAIPFADALKELNYTIIGMYLPAAADTKKDDGTVDTEAGTYAKANAFLSKIANFVYASTDLLLIKDVIKDKIVESINGFATGYTVKESIDPRFDLQTFDGTAWHLNGDGSVTIESAAIKNSDGQYSTVTLYFSDGKTQTYTADGSSYTLNRKLTKELGVRFHLSGEFTNGNARNPNLQYDSEKDMYYLEWKDQLIQTSPVGTDTMMPVWNAEYWLVAKDDFLGGDAVLTSGNEAKMNYIYHPADVSPEAYATYAFDSWLEHASTLRDQYESDWKKIRDAKGDKYEAYKTAWMHLMLAEQEAMRDAWNAKYGTDYQLSDFATGVYDSVHKVEVSGARIMFMIDAMSLKRTNEYDASSGTADSQRTYPEKMDVNQDGEYVIAANGERVPKIDELPSTGIPRIAVNVLPKSVDEVNLVSTIYLGELLSPVLALNNMVNNNYDNAYLNYLARYAYYLYPNKETPLLDLLSQWDDIKAVDGVKSFSVPYMYLPNYLYDAYGQTMGNKLNNAGVVNEHSEDVLGLLTFHWTVVRGSGAVDAAVVNDLNKTVWEGMEYEITVEFTAFREGDDYDTITDQCGEVTIFDAKLIGKVGQTLDKLTYDRTEYLNTLVTEDAHSPIVWTTGTRDATDEADTGSSDGEVDKNSITIAALAEYLDLDEEELAELVSNGKDSFVNHDRTQQVAFDYQPNVVGADLALELQIYGNQLKNWNEYTIGMEVQRKFTDNGYAENLKEKAEDDDNPLADYGDTFTITYSFDESSLDSLGDLSALDDDTQYTIYAKATVTGTFGGNNSASISALPVGNYSLATSSVTDKGNFNLNSLNAVTDATKYDSSYFSDRIGSLFDKDGNLKDSGNIAQVANSNDGTVISFGTTNNIRDYGSVICIIDITTSPTIITNARIVIVERGGKSNESFLYKLTNVNTKESIIVSVKGNSQTVIIVSFGTYTVEEISDWSWRYYDGKATGSETVWTFDTNNSKIAKTTINTDSTRTVTYTHEPNNKPWLGGESSNAYSEQ